MKDFMKKFPVKLVSISVSVIVVSFTYNILLDRDVKCTCSKKTRECSVHMALPFFIIFVLILWTDRTFWAICKFLRDVFSCGGDKWRGFLVVLAHHIVKAALVALLWVVSVLIDGDWWVCCRNDRSEEQSQLACKHKNDITAKDRKIITKLKNHSVVWGFSLLLGIICFLIFMSIVQCLCNEEIFYYKQIVKQEEKLVKEKLRDTAKDKLSEKIQRKMDAGEWRECFQVASELIKDEPTDRAAGPTVSQKSSRNTQNEGIELSTIPQA